MSDVDRFVRFCESSFGQTVMDREAAYVTEHVQDSDRILNVGCGIGSLEERLSQDVVGLDRSAAMLRTARQRARTTFVRGDATALPFSTGSFDAVVFVSTLAFVADAEAAVAEATRVLQPEGTLLALLLNTRSAYVTARRKRADSYFQRMVHTDTDALAETVLSAVDGTRERILGIEDDQVVDRTDPSTAAITAIVGQPTDKHNDLV